MKSWFNEFNRGRRLLKDEIREGPPKKTVVPLTSNDVRELIVQDRHVTYRDIALCLGISHTNMHSILHEQLVVKTICSH